MNLTVGPLPPAVYWRRRAIVAGGLLVVILLGFYACGGSGAPTKQSPTGLHTSTSPRVSASPPASHPVTVPSGPASGSPSAGGTPSGAPTPTVSGAAGAIPTCADKDVKVWPEITSTDPDVSRLRYGGTFDIKLNIKNTSDHACTRDVGAVPEELYVMRGKTQIWSSDKCERDTAVGKAHDVRTFQPNVQIYAKLQWSSYDITTNNCAKGSQPAAVSQDYQLFARVGTKLSAPVKFEITP
jgi:hypothetical protein